MADEPEEVEEEETEEVDNWGRFEEVIDKAVSKHLGALDIEGKVKGALKGWSPAAKNEPKNSPDSQPKEEKPLRSESKPRKKGLFSDSFFKGLGPKE